MAGKFSDRQRAVLDYLRAPAQQLFLLHGIRTKRSGEFLNVSTCVWCGHGKDGAPNFQCGIAETAGGRGLVHGYRCWHPHDSPDGNATPYYADVLVKLGVLTEDEAHWAKNLRSSMEYRAPVARRERVPSEKRSTRPAHAGVLRESRRRLRDNKQALEWLHVTRGYSADVLEHFALGLSDPYVSEKTGEVLTAHALTAPLRGADGTFRSKYCYYTVPGLTVDNREKKPKAWSPGPARTYYSEKLDGQTKLFVCDGMKDLWATWDKIRGTPLAKELLLITSTNGGTGYPDEWKDPSFWQRFETIYLGHDNDVENPKTGVKAGDQHARAIVRMTGIEMHRVWPEGVKDWNDFWMAGGTPQKFAQLLDESEKLTLADVQRAVVTGAGTDVGLLEAKAVAIAGAFHKGFLYDSVEVLCRDVDNETQQVVERLRTLVVRSDGTLHQVRPMPAPAGTPASQIVHRLVPWSDDPNMKVEPHMGILADGLVKPNPYGTWRWSSVKDFVSGRARRPKLATLFHKIRRHLQCSVWLPFEDDYTMLACTVIATYVQSIFESVPLLLATGAPGSGKTQMGIAMSGLACNAPPPIGQISAASIARLIDMSRGFVVLDDLEGVASKRNGDNQFDELIQAIKLCYNQSSATKYWTNMKTGRLEKLNFFGIKLINNTRGVDAILGTRMLTIATAKMREGQVLPTDGLLTEPERADLRDALHTWAFMNAKAVADTYSLVYPSKSLRSVEIAAPLRVVAELTDDADVRASLHSALEHQKRIDIQPENPDAILREAIIDIIADGIQNGGGVLRTVVTITEVMMTMAMLVDTNYGKSITNEIPDIESPEWVGRKLRQEYAKIGADQVRLQMFGKFLRGYPLKEEFLMSVAEKVGKGEVSAMLRSEDPRDFCRGCAECRLRYRCEMREAREAKEGSRPVLQ